MFASSIYDMTEACCSRSAKLIQPTIVFNKQKQQREAFGSQAWQFRWRDGDGKGPEGKQSDCIYDGTFQNVTAEGRNVWTVIEGRILI